MHIFGGETVNIDDYQIVFLVAPSSPTVGDNLTTLNFSVLQNSTNIYNIYSAVIIIEKNSGRIVEQIPYRVYESSDITLPFTFQNATDYTITLQTRITGDEKYQATPLVASFDISVVDSSSLIAFNELVLFYVTPVTLVITGIIIYQHVKGKESSDDINICYWMYYRRLIAFNHRVFPIAERLFSTLTYLCALSNVDFCFARTCVCFW